MTLYDPQPLKTFEIRNMQQRKLYYLGYRIALIFAYVFVRIQYEDMYVEHCRLVYSVTGQTISRDLIDCP